MAAESGHNPRIIAHRYRLVEPLDPAYAFPHTEAWLVHDVVLNQLVRGLIIDSDFDSRSRVLDAARRTALLNDAHAVSVISAVEDDSACAIFTEIPPGISLADLLADYPELLTQDNVTAIIGELASVINTARHSGIRHLQLTAHRIFISDSYDIVVDGFGIAAALQEVDTDKLSAELDSDETRGLSVFFASLLTGSDYPRNPDVHDDVISQARALRYLPERVEELFIRETGHNGPKSPDEFMRQIVPWGNLDLGSLDISSLPKLAGMRNGSIESLSIGVSESEEPDSLIAADESTSENQLHSHVSEEVGDDTDSNSAAEINHHDGGDGADVVLPAPHWPALPHSLPSDTLATGSALAASAVGADTTIGGGITDAKTTEGKTFGDVTADATTGVPPVSATQIDGEHAPTLTEHTATSSHAHTDHDHHLADGSNERSAFGQGVDDTESSADLDSHGMPLTREMLAVEKSESTSHAVGSRDPLVDIIGDQPDTTFNATPLWPSPANTSPGIIEDTQETHSKDIDISSAASLERESLPHADDRDTNKSPANHIGTAHEKADTNINASSANTTDAATFALSGKDDVPSSYDSTDNNTSDSLPVESPHNSSINASDTSTQKLRVTKGKFKAELQSLSDDISTDTSRAVVIFFALLVLLAFVLGIIWLFRPFSPVTVENQDETASAYVHYTSDDGYMS